MGQETLAERVATALREQAGLHVAVEEHHKTLTLSGLVESTDDREAAEEIARQVAPGYRIDNNLEVEMVVPTTVEGYPSEDQGLPNLPKSAADITALGADVEPDFTAQAILDDPTAASGPSSDYEDLVQEGDDVYVPPTDPVVTTGDEAQEEVLGGFGTTSMDSVEVPASAEDNRLGDEAIAEAIRRELREDAATTDLLIDVDVQQGVVRLRGCVPGVEDVENVESVAWRVPGVRDVVEELEVATLS